MSDGVLDRAGRLSRSRTTFGAPAKAGAYSSRVFKAGQYDAACVFKAGQYDAACVCKAGQYDAA